MAETLIFNFFIISFTKCFNLLCLLFLLFSHHSLAHFFLTCILLDKKSLSFNLYLLIFLIYRPTVINCYADGDMGSLDLWFPQWLHFLFDKSVSVKKGSSSDSKLVRIRDMLQPIKRSKYPALSQEEERISIPLQVVSCAIFDAILVHAMNKLANNWQVLRTDMCNKLNHHKLDRTIEILETTYADMDIQFLQVIL